MDPVSIVLALAQYAPQLIKWITGNETAEQVAAVAVDIARQVTGREGNEAVTAMALDPKLAAEFAMKVAAREAELTRAFLADTADARDHDVKIQDSANASYLAKNVAYWIDMFIVIATFLMAYLIMFKGVPPENKEIFYTSFGSLLTLCMTVVQFHRGSSARSQQKDTTISTLAGLSK